MKDVEQAKELARAMVDIGKQLKKTTVALITDMNQPLGNAIGNALEVKEAIAMLKGEGPNDLRQLCLELGSQMVYLAKHSSSIEEGKKKLIDALESGAALEKLKVFIQSQGGEPKVVDDPTLLPTAAYETSVNATKTGYISGIDAHLIGTAAMMLGAGREVKEAAIDLAVGIILDKKIGEKVSKGQKIATIHSNRKSVEKIVAMLENSFEITETKRNERPLIYDVIT